MADYTLNQLLLWGVEDFLIESFEEEDDQVIIWCGGERYRLGCADARTFMQGIMKGRHNLLGGGGAKDDIVES